MPFIGSILSLPAKIGSASSERLITREAHAYATPPLGATLSEVSGRTMRSLQTAPLISFRNALYLLLNCSNPRARPNCFSISMISLRPSPSEKSAAITVLGRLFILLKDFAN